jgi:signal transduction histidine kinase/ActR/RegA family two-component response regulator
MDNRLVEEPPTGSSPFEIEVTDRFGLLPNFFRSAAAEPELIQKLWSFAKAAYLDNPIPALFKERLFVVLSRLCPVRYCIVRHVGFLLGHGRPAGDASAPTHSIGDVIQLLKRPTPWSRDLPSVYAQLEAATSPLSNWPEPRTDIEDLIFTCAAVIFTEPARGDTARLALIKALGPSRFEYLVGLLAFIRTAHYWTMLHPEIETEEDMRALIREHAELARLLIEDPDADRCDMGARLFDELMSLRELNEREELKKAKAALEEKDRQKDQFIATLAHELRSPLAAIRSATDALRLLDSKDPTVERLRMGLDRQSTVMARMLDDLLDSARITFGKVYIQFDDINVSDVVREIVEENAQRVKAAGLHFVHEISNLPCYVRGDYIRLRQIIDNLLSNAIKFTPASGTIAVRLREDGSSVTLGIEDTGIGFASALASILFEPFVQQEQGSDRTSSGLGLGLAISRKLAELHGGSLSGQSSGVGQGAAFALTLPLATPPVKNARPVEQLRRTDRKRVLLVEDNKDAADALAELVGLLGCDVEVAYDGRSALARAVLTLPGLILCDLGLPGGMDGYAVAREVRADARLNQSLLVAVSGYSQPKDHAAAKQAGFDRLVPKPITVDSIEALLNDLLPKS